MRVLLAPDKFRGSLTAAEAVAALRDGVRRAVPDADMASVAVADGGDGTVDAVLSAGFDRVAIEVSGPLDERVDAAYARKGDTAVVELAEICGLRRMARRRRREPLAASTRGVGEAISHALDAGAQTVVVGLGGSASTDGGAGMLQALGARLRDGTGDDLRPGGGELVRLASVDLSTAHPRLREVELVAATDVTNRLLGPTGAAAVFGPQKGASAGDVTRLDYGLQVFALLVAEQSGYDYADQPGAGAAGGTGFGLLALGAQVHLGADVVLDLVGFDAALDRAELAITGEGCLDAQSLAGKAPAVVAHRARSAGVPTLAVVGRCELDEAQAREAGFAGVYAVADIEADPRRQTERAADLVAQRAETALRRWRTAAPASSR